MARYTPSGTVASVPAINTELERISEAVKDSLSRKGDSPNQMEVPLDMNGSRILNTGEPLVSTDVARLKDVEALFSDLLGEGDSTYTESVYIETLAAGQLGTTLPFAVDDSAIFVNGELLIPVEEYGSSGTVLTLVNGFPENSTLLAVRVRRTIATGEITGTTPVFKTPEDYGAIGDGVVDDTVAVGAAFASNEPLLLKGGSSYLISQQTIIPDNTTVYGRDAEFVIGYTESGSAPAIRAGEGSSFEELAIRVPAGQTFNRVIEVEDRCHIERLSCVSEDQMNNRGDKLHGAVQLRGDGIEVGKVVVDKFDNSAVAFRANSLVVGSFCFTNYVRGCYIDETDVADIVSIRAETASPNATTDPGHNGLLIEDSTHLSFGKVAVSEAGEHAVRISGSVSGGGTKHITFGTITAFKPGQCAFKVNPDAGTATTDINVGVISSTDCAATSTTGTNEDVIRLEKCTDITIGQVNGNRQDKSTCANDGIYLNNAQRVVIGDCQFDNPNRSMVYIDDAAGQCRDIFIRAFSLYSCVGTPIVIDSPAENIEHIQIENGYMRDTTADAAVVDVTANSPTGGVPNPVIFRFDVDVSGFTSPGTVTSSDLIASNTSSSRLYNEMTPRA